MPLTQPAESTQDKETATTIGAEADGDSAARARKRKKRSPRREHVVDHLREAITVGRLADGDRLIEERIATELHTSRGPVREALRQLEHEGLVVSYPYRGAVVLGVSEEEIQQVLIPIRLTLERFSFTKALEQMEEPDFAEIAKEVWTMAEAARAGELLRLVEADIRFHEFVLSRSGQPHTTQVWRSIAPRIRAYFFRYGLTADLPQIAVEHGQLLQAMQTRNRDTVLAAVERHITVRTPGP
jgi:DNA-binding GntR family transcriptional regulator